MSDVTVCPHCSKKNRIPAEKIGKKAKCGSCGKVIVNLGTVKWFSNEKGYGFIVSQEQKNDLFFHIKEYLSEEPIQSGDRVSFGIGPGKKGEEAKGVRFVARGELPRRFDKPYYGKPRQTPDNSSIGAKTGAALGAVVGSAGGIIGAVVGAAVGSAWGALSGMPQNITSTCLKCGGTGHPTAETETHIGFQCEKCKAFWKQKL